MTLVDRGVCAWLATSGYLVVQVKKQSWPIEKAKAQCFLPLQTLDTEWHLHLTFTSHLPPGSSRQ